MTRESVKKSIGLIIILLALATVVDSKSEIGIATRWDHTNDEPIDDSPEVITDPYGDDTCHCPCIDYLD